MFPLSAIARTFNRNNETITTPITKSRNIVSTPFLTNLNIHLAKYTNNDDKYMELYPI